MVILKTNISNPGCFGSVCHTCTINPCLTRRHPVLRSLPPWRNVVPLDDSTRCELDVLPSFPGADTYICDKHADALLRPMRLRPTRHGAAESWSPAGAHVLRPSLSSACHRQPWCFFVPGQFVLTTAVSSFFLHINSKGIIWEVLKSLRKSPNKTEIFVFFPLSRSSGIPLPEPCPAATHNLALANQLGAEF